MTWIVGRTAKRLNSMNIGTIHGTNGKDAAGALAQAANRFIGVRMSFTAKSAKNRGTGTNAFDFASFVVLEGCLVDGASFGGGGANAVGVSVIGVTDGWVVHCWGCCGFISGFPRIIRPRVMFRVRTR